MGTKDEKVYRDRRANGYTDWNGAELLQQSEAGYVALTPDAERACAACRWYQGMEQCAIVYGLISPAGTCGRFEAMGREMPVLAALESVAEIAGGKAQSVLDAMQTKAHGFKILSDNRWIAWYTNAYRDKDDEYFPEAAIEADIDYIVESGDYPELWFYHLEGTKWGQATAVAKVGRFAVAVGEFDNTPLANALKAWTERRKAEGATITLSHGFSYLKAAKADGVYNVFHTVEISTLEEGDEANELTNFVLIEAEAEMDKKKAIEILTKALEGTGINVDNLLDAGAQATKLADEVTGFDYKAENGEDKPSGGDMEKRMSKLEKAMERLAEKLDGMNKQAYDDKPKPDDDEDEKKSDNPETVTVTLEELATIVEKAKAATPQTASVAPAAGIAEVEGLLSADMRAVIKADVERQLKGRTESGEKEEFDMKAAAAEIPGLQFLAMGLGDEFAEATAKSMKGAGR